MLKLACKKFQIQKRGNQSLKFNLGKQKGEPKLVQNPRVGGTKALHTMPSEVSFNLISRKHTKYLTNLHIIRIFFNPISLLCIIRYPPCFLFHGVHQNLKIWLHPLLNSRLLLSRDLCKTLIYMKWHISKRENVAS